MKQLKFIIIFLVSSIGSTLLLCNSNNFGPQGPLVVLDAGHGGRAIIPYSVYGDKYDITSHRYLDHFREGANHKGMWENEAMYFIATRVSKILELTLKESTHNEFRKMIKPFGTIKGAVKPIRTALSREDNYFKQYEIIKDDPNAPYRLYDYVDIHTGEKRLGTISRINALSPELVISIHLAKGAAPKVGGLASVLTPGFDTFAMAREYVKNPRKRKSIQKKFSNGPYSKWFISAYGYNRFQSFLCDAWIYFTGNWSKPNGLHLKDNKFRGFRQHMISWHYANEPNWEQMVRTNPPNTPYAAHLKNFKATGKFWEREQSEPERWRREGGVEGKGGDNFFASQEILRFIRKGFFSIEKTKKDKLPEIMDPYISTWAVPTYTNAVSAYLEVAHLSSAKDFARMRNKKGVYARSIAAAIYSMVYSLALSNPNNLQDFPKGNTIDFQKYTTFSQGNYFKMSSAKKD